MNFSIQNNLTLYALLVLLVSFIIINLPPEFVDSESARTILSTIFQGLATLLGIIFTVTLFATQFSSQYSLRIPSKWLFGLKFFPYIILLFFSLVFPLYALQWIPNGDQIFITNLVKISLFLCISSLLLLIPVVVEIGHEIRPENLINGLLNQGLDVISKMKGPEENRGNFKSDESKLYDVADPLRDIAIESSKRRDFITFQNAVYALFTLMSELDKQEKKQNCYHFFHNGLAESMFDILDISAENDIKTAKRGLYTLTYNGIKGIYRDNAQDVLFLIGSKFLYSRPELALNALQDLETLLTFSLEYSLNNGESPLQHNNKLLAQVLLLGIQANQYKKFACDEKLKILYAFNEAENIERVEKLSISIIRQVSIMLRRSGINETTFLDAVFASAYSYYKEPNIFLTSLHVRLQILDFEGFRDQLNMG